MLKKNHNETEMTCSELDASNMLHTSRPGATEDWERLVVGDRIMIGFEKEPPQKAQLLTSKDGTRCAAFLKHMDSGTLCKTVSGKRNLFENDCTLFLFIFQKDDQLEDATLGAYCFGFSACSLTAATALFWDTACS